MTKSSPPDQLERRRALDSSRSILVQAPAGSGKTTLLTERFLTLLAEVDDPSEIVAITFTKAAAAEMRNRILDELGKASKEAMPGSLVRRVLDRSEKLGWKLPELPAQLRITTIDAFCRELALRQPLLSGLGGGLEIAEEPGELYRSAARATLQQIDSGDAELRVAVEALLLWRDNNWQDVEDQLVEMLADRDRWMQDFVLAHEPDWEALRGRLERPFAQALQQHWTALSGSFLQLPGALEEALDLARFACEERGDQSPLELAAQADIPAPRLDSDAESSREFYILLADFLLTQKGAWRSEKGLKTANGFPSTPRGRSGKARFAALIARLSAVSGLEAMLAGVRLLPPARYADDDWQIIRACFTLLRHAAAELHVVFAETGTVDYTQIAQIALQVLRDAEKQPTDTALAVGDEIRHLLIDEFQDTSRRQHELLAHLVAAWPERPGRTVFAVGDPMQSIYFFRDADAELFGRVRELGLEIPNSEPLPLEFVPLRANFRTAPALVEQLNEIFLEIFAANDGSGISFTASEPAREAADAAQEKIFKLHLDFVPQKQRGAIDDSDKISRNAQIAEIVSLIQSYQAQIEEAEAQGKKCRIAVLGRTKKHLAPIAEALRAANQEAATQGKKKIPFRAVELETLAARPEIQDALALARALLNPLDRVAWLGVLRAPWCGLSLADLHLLVSGDDFSLLSAPVPELIPQRKHLLSKAGRAAVERLLTALEDVPALRAQSATPGTRLEQVWRRLGGAACVDATAQSNLNLLWSFLDRLPEGEESLLAPGFEASLNKLTAQPDPEAGLDCGAQLMTIHKAKGLEFEIVLVPELQASGRNSMPKMLSWLERGLEKETAEAITEFLVAPQQQKGGDRGLAKAWVDRVYRERESQEMRRILYVAATRAREELHLFARPAYKSDATGEPTLLLPSKNLLATAWPALEAEVRNRFAEWARFSSSSEGLAIAATEENLLTMPSAVKPTLLRRLPQDFAVNIPSASRAVADATPERLYTRHEGGQISRAFGNAVHALLERVAAARMILDWDAARAELRSMQPRIAAEMRAAGLEQNKADELAARALEVALQAASEPTGQWILSPQKEAASEPRWSAVVRGQLRTVQPDRVFRAGAEPKSEGDQVWWIIDYKTALGETAESLPELRKIFAAQLEVYADVLRALQGKETKVFVGLYYPRMLLLDWWNI